jgi:hypothetical protein
MTSQKMQRTVETEGKITLDTISTDDSKFSSLQRKSFVQGSGNVPAFVSSSMVLGGSAGTHCLQPQHSNLVPGLGGKQTKQLKQGQSAAPLLSPPQQSHQHAGTSAAAQMGLKSTDHQSSDAITAMPVVGMPRDTTIGPGPLGLAPVASVMAPQGHAMLQNITDPGKTHGQQHTQHHQSVPGRVQPLSLPSCQQQQRAGQLQRGPNTVAVVEEGRSVVESTVFTNRSGREYVEERKPLLKRSSGVKGDVDNSAASQGPPSFLGPSAARMSSSSGPALNLLTTAPAILVSRTPGHLIGSSVQQSSTPPAVIHTSKQATARSKVLGGSGSVSAVTSPTSQLPSFSERASLAPSSSNKVSGPSISLPGQSLAHGSQALRQGQVTQQHQQLKLSNRNSVGSLPTPSGTAPQAVLAAAMAKSQQGVQQQQLKSQVQVSSNAGLLPRSSSGSLGGFSTNSSIAAKSVASGATKSNLSGKKSFSVSQRPSSAVPGKRSTPPSFSNASSILGPLIQTTSTKCQQLQSQNQALSHQQQNPSPRHTQVSQQLPQTLQQPSQVLTPTHQQYLHQQSHCSTPQLHQMHNQQPLVQPQQAHHMQRQLFLQNPAFQLHQHPAGSQLSSQPQQQSGIRQQTHQQSPHVQTHLQGNSPASQLHLQPQQPHACAQQQQQNAFQAGTGALSATIPSGNLSLASPVLTLGTGSNGTANPRIPGSDGVSTSQCSGARSIPASSRGSGCLGLDPLGASLPRSQCGSFLHAQIGSVIPGQQRSSSPGQISGPQHLQPIASSGGSEIAADEIGVSGGI